MRATDLFDLSPGDAVIVATKRYTLIFRDPGTIEAVKGNQIKLTNGSRYDSATGYLLQRRWMLEPDWTTDSRGWLERN